MVWDPSVATSMQQASNKRAACMATSPQLELKRLRMAKKLRSRLHVLCSQRGAKRFRSVPEPSRFPLNSVVTGCIASLHPRSSGRV